MDAPKLTDDEMTGHNLVVTCPHCGKPVDVLPDDDSPIVIALDAFLKINSLAGIARDAMLSGEDLNSIVFYNWFDKTVGETKDWAEMILSAAGMQIEQIDEEGT